MQGWRNVLLNKGISRLFLLAAANGTQIFIYRDMFDTACSLTRVIKEPFARYRI
jgi:hypothetical protein